MALRGESTVEMAGDGGMCRLGKDVAPVGGADSGWVGYGLGEAMDAGDLWFPQVHEQSVCSLLAVEGIEFESWAASSSSSVELPDLFSGITGEDTETALRKSM